MSDSVSDHPQVTVVIPLRNEAAHLAHVMHALRAQTYARHIAQVLFVDGMSTDRTRAVIGENSRGLPAVRIIDNPQIAVPQAMNRGIRAASGDIIIRLDAHCEPAPDYVERCVHHLRETGAWNVGGPMRARGQGYVGQAVALATTSPFGIGGSPFHYSDEPQYVDTVYLGAFPRWVFDKVGLYDERFVRNQDYELNHRIRKAGGAIFLAPDIRITYFPRDSLRALWRQYFQYGFWKVQTLRKHPDSLKWRHLVAPAFVAGLVGGLLVGLLWRPALVLWMLAVGLYIILALAFSLMRARREPGGLRYLPLMPVVFATLHVAWGLGFWWAWVALLLGRDPLAVPDPAAERATDSAPAPE
ncbi:MAG: glycosyltransferase family 2 protein [Anaerolineae bacterium]|nr:glycosyltransferase family 2 protein [Anaerolineae bacterium]